MLLPQPMAHGRLVQRYKRFFADVVLDDGREITTHCPNPGAMLGLSTPGLGAWVSASDAPKRKLPWTLELVEVDGGLSGLGGDLDTVVFDAVTIFDESLGSTCPTEPGGVVSVRDVSGDWYDVVFDGPTEYGDESDPDLCDGCGAAYYRGEYLGQVCSDFTGMLDWEGTPW